MKLRKTAAIAAVLSGAALALGAAHAQPIEKVPSEKFRSLDRNGDGFLSKSETSHIRDYDKAFAKADENRDGKLSPEEFTEAEAIYDRMRVGKYIEDSALTAKVKTALLRERGLKSTDISVETNRGRVMLSGFVQSEEQRQAALRVAAAVDGVREVKDGMAVK